MTNADLVLEQMRAGHRYQNTLIEIERARRLAIADTQAAVCSDIDPMRARIDEIERDIAAVWAGVVRKNLSATERKSLRDATVPLDAERKVIREQIKKLKASNADALKEAYAEVDARKNDLVKAARAQCGAYWGTYLLAEKAVEDTIFAHDCPPEGPRFRAWRDYGRIGVQLQGGEDAAVILGDTDTRLQILDTQCGRTPKTHAAKSGVYKTLRIRVGSDERRRPVWADFPMKMDRPLPPMSRIKNAYVTMERIHHGRVSWHVCITVESPALGPAVIHRGKGTVAVNLGWRVRDEGVRVATWASDDGRTGEIFVPAACYGEVRKADDLRSIRDREFNAAREALIAASIPDAPQWLADAQRWAHAWKSTARLTRLVTEWYGRRFDGDEAIFASLVTWHSSERHLLSWETDARISATRRRDFAYRMAAIGLARDFTTIVISDESHADLAQETAKDPAQAIRRNRFGAAPGTLRAELKSCARKHGAEVAAVSAKNITVTCHACERLCAWDRRVDIWHRCEHCGVAWDQDINAARNMLRVHASGGATPETREPLAEPENKEETIAVVEHAAPSEAAE